MRRGTWTVLAAILALAAALPATAAWETFLAPDTYAVSKMAITPDGTWVLLGNEGDTFVRSRDGGVTWETTLTGLPGIADICALPGGIILLACAEDGMLRSSDNGATWQEPAGLPAVAYNCQAIGRSPVTGTLVAHVDRIYEYGETSLYVSHDDGASWQPLDPPLFPDVAITLIRADAAGNFYLGQFETGLMRSTDDGQTWQQVANLEDDYFCFTETAGGTLLVGTSTVYRSDDGGATWTYSGDGLSPWRSAAGGKVGMNGVSGIARGAGGDLFLSYLMTGVFRSVDGGFTWARCDSGLTDTYDVTHAVDDSQGNVYVSFTLGGVYHWTADATPAPTAAAAVRLWPAAPNPCNPRTVLRFSLPRSMPVTLDLLDAAGRRVRRLWEGPRPAGPQAVTCDGRDLAGGVYFYRLTGPGWSRTGRFTLVR